MNKEELKKLACEIIDSRHDDIHALGDSIFAEPETGWKEFKTAEKIKRSLKALASRRRISSASPASSPT